MRHDTDDFIDGYALVIRVMAIALDVTDFQVRRFQDRVVKCEYVRRFVSDCDGFDRCIFCQDDWRGVFGAVGSWC